MKQRILISYASAAVAVAAVFILVLRGRSTTSATDVLRVAFPSYGALKDNDPSNIVTSRQANVVRNLYSRLVFMDDGGNLQPNIAQSFIVEGRNVTIAIREDLRTVSGQRIDASDVMFSFKRLILMNQNTHGDLQQFLCPTTTMKSVDDGCPGLKQAGQKIILTTTTEAQARYLMPLLSGLDFSIVPKTSVNKKLEIVDYRNTSGPYYAEIDRGGGSIQLRANPNHFQYSALMPQTIELQYLAGPDAIKAFENGTVDMITTIDTSPFSKIINLARTRSDSNLHRTLDIRLLFMQFTKRGLRDFSDPEDRLAIGMRIKAAAASFLNQTGLTPTNEYFPATGSGRLEPARAQKVQDLLDEASKANRVFTKTPRISFGKNAATNYLPIVKASGFEPVPTGGFPLNDPIEIQPDTFITMTDSSYDESLSFIAYNINTGTFDLTREQGDKWLNTFMETRDKAERIEMLRDLHFDALRKGIVVPIAFGPYTAIIRKPWEMNFPKTVAGTPLWLIRRP